MEEDDPNNPKLKYLTDYAKLPSDAPVGHPHLVDPKSVPKEYPQDELTIADLVVTILFKFMPEALIAFLDLDRPQGPLHSRRHQRQPLGFLHQERPARCDREFRHHSLKSAI